MCASGLGAAPGWAGAWQRIATRPRFCHEGRPFDGSCSLQEKASKEAFDIIRAQLAGVFGIPCDDLLDEQFRETKDLAAMV